jgi:hypothetical protein
VIHPLVIQESLVCRFRYWSESIQEGMYFKHDLYTYFQSFSAANRLAAYAAAYEQIEQGNAVCITVSETRYIIWLSLRTRDANGNIDALLSREVSRNKANQEEVCLDS